MEYGIDIPWLACFVQEDGNEIDSGNIYNKVLVKVQMDKVFLLLLGAAAALLISPWPNELTEGNGNWP